MVSVASLLNHDTEGDELMTPTASSRYSSECSPAPSERVSKKPRLAKDAAVFHKSKISGHVNYRPYETSEPSILEELERMNVFPLPLTKIVEFPRHIPYNSDKKQLYQRTGRDSFEVFQYTFQPPGHEQSYAVLWDYNIGLVRMTPFFKCCRYPKTVPSKMLNLNPGLRAICYSITGGSLVAQGYWLPFEAAKALAATFCWDFRHALVPIFGPDFPSLCARPGSSGHSTMLIDQRIIKQCTKSFEVFLTRNQKSAASASAVPAKLVGNTSAPNADIHGRHGYNGFLPINRRTSMPTRETERKIYRLPHTPVRTPESSCLSSPDPSTNGSAKPSTSLKRLQIPHKACRYQIRDTKGPSSPPHSSDSGSESDVSPKTNPSKRRCFVVNSRARPTLSRQLQTETGDLPDNECVSEADVRAAQILVDLRVAVQSIRKKELEGSILV